MLSAERDVQIRERQARTDAQRKVTIQAEVFEHHESSRRREFLNSLNSMPGFDLPTTTEAKLLDTVRDCRCGMKEIYTNAVAKIEITSGPFAGKVGWVCDEPKSPPVGLALRVRELTQPPPTPPRALPANARPADSR